jgi:hypothetical protein
MELLEDRSAFKCRASSTLNRSAEFAVANMFSSDDSCWNSEGNSEAGQWLLFDFLGKAVEVQRLQITFQGGFVGQDGLLEVKDSKEGDEKATIVLDEITRIEDNNDIQEWSIPAAKLSQCRGKFVKISFPSSTDFYGRVTIYKLALRGTWLQEEE